MSRPHPLKPGQVGRTLADRLIPLADSVRQLYTDFGLRPYRIFLVWIEWKPEGAVLGGQLDFDEVGAGEPTLVREIELLPTPRVELGGVGKDFDAVGTTERGSVGVSEISESYSEDQLTGLLNEFRDPKYPDTLRQGIDFFWEIREERPPQGLGRQFGPCDSSGGYQTVRRRFHVSGVPVRQADRFQWFVSLIRADGERSRSGSVEPTG